MALRFENVTHYGFQDETYRAFDVRRYRISKNGPPGGPAPAHQEVLEELIEQNMFADAYISSNIPSRGTDDSVCHGVYYLEAIKVSDFEAVTITYGVNLIDEFLRGGFRKPTRADVGIEDLVDHIEAAEAIYYLRHLGEEFESPGAFALHEFEELIVFEKDSTLLDVVAMQD